MVRPGTGGGRHAATDRYDPAAPQCAGDVRWSISAKPGAARNSTERDDAHYLAGVYVSRAGAKPDRRAAFAGGTEGLRLPVFRLAHPPPPSECARLLASGLDLPLLRGEVRMFLTLPPGSVFRQAALGPDATCGSAGGVITCADGPSLPPGTAPPPGPPLPTVSAPTLDIAGPTLDRLLSFGWAHDHDGLARSEGNWATLLFRLARPDAGDAVTVDLQLRARATVPGAAQSVMIGVNGSAPLAATLTDQRTTPVTVRIPLANLPDGIVRIALNIPNAIDLSRAGLAMAADQSGVVLQSIDVRVADPRRAEPRD